jgi:hypothetical protein
VAAGNYVPCATTASYAFGSVGFTTPAGFTPSVTAVAYWNGSGWTASCGTDSGLQQVKVQVASNDTRASEQLMIVVRKPCGLAASPC